MKEHKLQGVTVKMKKVDFSSYRGKMAIYLSDGRIILTPVGMFPDIKKLTMQERQQYFIVEGQYLAFMRQPEMYPVTDFFEGFVKKMPFFCSPTISFFGKKNLEMNFFYRIFAA